MRCGDGFGDPVRGHGPAKLQRFLPVVRTVVDAGQQVAVYVYHLQYGLSSIDEAGVLSHACEQRDDVHEG